VAIALEHLVVRTWRIEWVAPPSQPRWRKVLIVVGAALAAGLLTWNLWQTKALQRQRSDIEVRTVALSALAPKPVAAPARPTPEQARALEALGWDWMRVYAPLERLDLPGMRVLSLEVDAASRVAQLELLVPDESAIPFIAERLNAGPSTARWTLQSIHRHDAGTAAVGVRTLWGGRFD